MEKRRKVLYRKVLFKLTISSLHVKQLTITVVKDIILQKMKTIRILFGESNLNKQAQQIKLLPCGQTRIGQSRFMCPSHFCRGTIVPFVKQS